MNSLSLDTSIEVQRIHFALLRDAPPGKKLKLTFDLIQMLRRLVLADVRRQLADASEDEIRRQLIARLLPREDVIRAYGFDPQRDPPQNPS